MLNRLKRIYFDFLGSMIWVFAHTIGKLHMPWSRKEADFSHYIRLMRVIKPGDIILTRTKGEGSTLIIPGYWKHNAVYIGGGKVAESVVPKARISLLGNLIMRTDDFLVRRLINITPEEREEIVRKAISFNGREYDDRSDMRDDDEVNCSELCYHSINAARPGTLELRYRGGYPTFSPQDCADAESKFTTVMEIK